MSTFKRLSSMNAHQRLHSGAILFHHLPVGRFGDEWVLIQTGEFAGENFRQRRLVSAKQAETFLNQLDRRAA